LHFTLPVRGTYPQIRHYIKEALAAVPTLSLAGIRFDRESIDDPMINARVKWVVYLGRKV
jgi:hypothetical protein